MKKYLLLFVVVIILGAGFYYSELQFLSYSQSTASTSSAALATSTAAQGDTLAAQNAASTEPRETISFTLSAGGKNYSGHVPTGATVLDAMSALASVGDFQFTSKAFPGMGAFVESINGKINSDGFYWILYTNGKSSDTGASQTTIRSGDRIEWRYEKGY